MAVVMPARDRMVFQATRPRGARPGRLDFKLAAHDVSSHAPARGATSCCRRAFRRRGCFKPRAREGRDSISPAAHRAPRCFKPRAREGRDLLWSFRHFGIKSFQATRPRGARRDLAALDVVLLSVSSHAPARGATRPWIRPQRWLARFKPRAREGRDSGHRWTLPCRRTFQATRPRGARHKLTKKRVLVTLFQATRPRGARPDHRRPPGRRGGVSSHAPARGATIASVISGTICCSFQATRPRGARLAETMAALGVSTFQATRPRGARPASHKIAVIF